MEKHKPHVALISSLGLGHLIPVIELAKRFAIQHNFKATVLAVTGQTSESEAQTQILKSDGNPSLCDIVEIPGADISAFIEPNDVVCPLRVLSLTMRETKPAICSALSNMTPRPSTIIFDVFCADVMPVAEEFKARKFVFVASHACLLSLMMYSPVLDKQIEGQYVDLKEPLQIPGCKSVKPEDLIEPMQDRNSEQYQLYLRLVNAPIGSDAFLVNTWEELQHRELQALTSRIIKAPVYGIGPIVRQAESRASLVTEPLMEWLDEQTSESVIYVSFGSGGTLSFAQVTEVAWGLQLSGHRFVWVVRSPSVASLDAAFFGPCGSDDNKDDPLSYLPEGFLARTQNFGRLIPHWAPQVAILSHPCVGGFLSHCGWSSTLESITNGVPMIAWPLYAEQRMNATLLAEELRVAVRPKVLPEKKVVDREEVACLVRQIMEMERDAKPNPIRERMKELKHSALKAVSKGGSSYIALSDVAKQCEGS